MLTPLDVTFGSINFGLIADVPQLTQDPKSYSPLQGWELPIPEDSTLDSFPNMQVGVDRDTPSMSRRRQACNRPTLKLTVNIPSATSSSAHLGPPTSNATPITPSFLPSSSAANRMSPSTPIEKRMNTPLGPPEIPRVIDMRRNMAGRWMPTPTEGIIPAVPSAESSSPITSACSNGSSTGNFCRSSSIVGSAGCSERPKLGNRALSWLSIPVRGDGQHGRDDLDALASPFATSIFPALD